MRGRGHPSHRLAWAAWLGLCVSSYACNVYDPSLVSRGNASVPSRPPSGTSSPDDSETLVFGLKDVYIQQSAEMASRTGLDLDDTMTSSPEEATCEPRSVDGEVVGQPVVDGLKGIDNSLGMNLLPTVGSALPCLEDNIALTQGRGIGTIVLWVRDWNGEDDDAQVSAVLTTAVDGTSEDPSQVDFRGNGSVDLEYAQGRPGTPAPDPEWAFEDSWFVDPGDFRVDEDGAPSLDRPRIVQADAYVASGRLVVPLVDETEFKLIAGDGSLPSDGGMAVLVNGGFLLGDISTDRRELERGLFTGRFTLEALGEATPKIGMCEINASVIENLFGQFADIRGSSIGDGSGQECDAFSLGVTFWGVEGRIGGLAPASRPSLAPCAGGEPVPVDRCCPSQWADGESREETCTSEEQQSKAALFDALPGTVEIPVPAPEPLF